MDAETIEIMSPQLRRLFADWDTRRRGREFPARADFDPVELKYLLGEMTLLDVIASGPRSDFRYRVYGSSLVRRFGWELTGKSVDEIPVKQHAAFARAHCEDVLARRAPVVRYYSHHFIGQNVPHDCEILVLPLSHDGAAIDKMLGAFAWNVTRD